MLYWWFAVISVDQVPAGSMEIFVQLAYGIGLGRVTPLS
jgi:hypothetical protein